VRLEGLGRLKNDLPACSVVPQPTTLPRAPGKLVPDPYRQTMKARKSTVKAPLIIKLRTTWT
jgi:hypothetical protein